MPSVQRCPSPEKMPHLEPLCESSTQASDTSGSIHGPSTTPDPLMSETPCPLEQKSEGDMRQLMSKVMEPLKLSLVLENKGNVARDHLASERTYLAYVRTSLACASAGVALVQLFMLRSTTMKQTNGVDLTIYAKPLGATIILFALIILVMGLFRYFATQSALIRGYFPVARNSITAVAFVLGALVAIVFGIVVAGTQN